MLFNVYSVASGPAPHFKFETPSVLVAHVAYSKLLLEINLRLFLLVVKRSV